MGGSRGRNNAFFILLNASDMRSALNFGLGLLHNCVFLHSAYSSSPAFYFNRLLTVLFQNKTHRNEWGPFPQRFPGKVFVI